MTYRHSDFHFIDAHVHLFPPEIFNAIWKFFERRDNDGKVQGWPIEYKCPPDKLVSILKSFNVEYFTVFNYAHKKGIAEYINDWTYEFASQNKEIIPFGCIWPEDENLINYVKKIFEEYNFFGIKIQPLVQKIYPYDERLDEIYKLIVDRGKWIAIHAGTAPYRNKFVGYNNFLKFIKKFPNINVIVAHMGAFEYDEFFGLLENYDNLYLDTTMIFIPNNIFPERKTRQPSTDQLIANQDRILFGSDFPNIPYQYQYSTMGLLEFDLPKDFYEHIFYKNAKRIFGI